MAKFFNRIYYYIRKFCHFIIAPPPPVVIVCFIRVEKKLLLSLNERNILIPNMVKACHEECARNFFTATKQAEVPNYV